MKRKLLCICLIVVLSIGLSLPASADVLWEPYDVLFYRSGLPRIDQTYFVLDGMTVNVYDHPFAKNVIKTMVAGDRMYVGAYDTVRGETWGVGYIVGSSDVRGWVRLDRLQKEYNNKDFYADFGDQCIATADQLTQLDIEREIQTWTYPGSGVLERTIPKEALQGGYNNGVMDFQYAYTDPDGGRWGYVGYFMGRCSWVYLDDPETTDAPVFPQTPDNTVTDTEPGESNGISVLWILLPVLTAAAITAGVIFRVKKIVR